MTDQLKVLNAGRHAAQAGFAGRLAKARPVAMFLVLTFAWTWLFWFAAIPFRQHPLLATSLVLIGGFGPALASVETLRLRSGAGLDLSAKRLAAMGLSAAVIFSAVCLRYLVGNAKGVQALAPDLTLTAPTVVAAIVACLVGGWVISAAVSNGREVRERISSILPWNLPLRWTVVALAFYPAMILASWGLATLLNFPVEYPALWGQSAFEVLPLYALSSRLPC